MPESPDDALLADIEAHAADIARGAGAILNGYFGKALDVEYKDKGKTDPVTSADRETQDYLAKAIAGRFPDHGILGEEDREQEDSPAQDFVWVLDPLDGTKNFVGGLPVYACSVGVIHRGVPVAGAVFVPWPNRSTGAVFHARRGGGARMDQEPISVFKADEPTSNSLLALPGGFRSGFRFGKQMRGKVGDVRATGSIAYEMAMTARGTLQYSITTSPRLWDVAAGVTLVTEAGGLVMRGLRDDGLKSLLASTRWEIVESFVPSWESGRTTMEELRRWSAPLVLGSPGVVRYVTSNTRRRLLLNYRLALLARRVGRGTRKRSHG